MCASQHVTWHVIRVSGTELSHIDRARPPHSLSLTHTLTNMHTHIHTVGEPTWLGNRQNQAWAHCSPSFSLKGTDHRVTSHLEFKVNRRHLGRLYSGWQWWTNLLQQMHCLQSHASLRPNCVAQHEPSPTLSDQEDRLTLSSHFSCFLPSLLTGKKRLRLLFRQSLITKYTCIVNKYTIITITVIITITTIIIVIIITTSSDHQVSSSQHDSMSQQFP